MQAQVHQQAPSPEWRSYVWAAIVPALAALLIGLRTLGFETIPRAALHPELAGGWGHVYTVLLHTAAAALLAVFATMLSRRPLLGLLAGLLFALHPIHHMAVGWPGAVRFVEGGVLLPAALLLLRFALCKPCLPSALAVTVLLFVAVWRNPYLAPVPLTALLAMRLGIWPLTGGRPRWARAMPAVAAGVLVFGVVRALASVSAEAGSDRLWAFALGDAPFAGRQQALVDGVAALVVPHRLLADYAPQYLAGTGYALLALPIIGALLIGGLLLGATRRAPVAALGSLWLGLALPLTLLAGHPVRHDARLYVAAMGAALLVASLLMHAGDAVRRRRPALRHAVTAVAVVLVALLVWAGLRPYGQWRSAAALWERTAQQQPLSLLARIARLPEHREALQAKIAKAAQDGDSERLAELLEPGRTTTPILTTADAWRQRADGRDLPEYGTVAIFLNLERNLRADDPGLAFHLLRHAAETYRTAPARHYPSLSERLDLGLTLAETLELLYSELRRQSEIAREAEQHGQLVGDWVELSQRAAAVRESLGGVLESCIEQIRRTPLDQWRLPELQRRLARLRVDAGKLAEASVLLQRALGDRPDEATREAILSDLSDLAAQRGEIATAIKYQRRALRLDDEGTPRRLARLGELLYEQAKLDEAETYVRRAIEALDVTPESPLEARRPYARHQLLLGRILADRGLYADALHILERAAELDPDALDIRREILRVTEAGVDGEARTRHEKAREHFARAEALVEDDLTGAIRQYKLAIAHDPFFVEANYRVGQLLARQAEAAGDIEAWKDATQHLQVCVNERPREARYAFALARAHQALYGLYWELGQGSEYRTHLRKARRYFHQTVRLNAHHADAWLHLAWIAGLHETPADFETARIYAENARRLGNSARVEFLMEKIAERKRDLGTELTPGPERTR